MIKSECNGDRNWYARDLWTRERVDGGWGQKGEEKRKRKRLDDEFINSTNALGQCGLVGSSVVISVSTARIYPAVRSPSPTIPAT